MKEHMMHRMGSDLILTPNRVYNKINNVVIISAVLFLILGLFLFVRFGDFWQMPLAIGLCIGLPAMIHKIAVVQQQIIIPSGKDAQIVFCVGKIYKNEIFRKNQVTVISNTLNGKTYYAVASKQNPYGKSYQISPFLNKQKTALIFQEEVLPVIRQQLEIQ
ncbi:hypothetical protein N0B40_05725 [Chryseobacterium oranimense]|uniref:hypothetical protein n=1 Tax=Chryseobacterium oranimense TaxID=421058 RepID=UPI0021B06C3A|nr:hypothetical protein [Chryseobacterium oranimense]UWX61778.1 hypothetical protein N0B40_05725 [Chryseobacterium oranimense]